MGFPGDDSYIHYWRQDDVAYGPGGWFGGVIFDPCSHSFSQHLDSTFADILWL
jgi:hypothetical protein